MSLNGIIWLISFLLFILNRMLFIFFLVLFIALIIIAYLTSRIDFLGRHHITEIIQHNHTFYDRFTLYDLEARGVQSVDEYLSAIRSDMSSFTLYEKARLIYCCMLADRRIRAIRYEWFDGEKAASMKWRLGCVEGTRYEAGLPHTIGDVIILFHSMLSHYTTNDLVDTLIHEKTHVYQRKYPSDVARYLTMSGFQYEKHRDPHDRIRVNPDTDDIVYRRNGDSYQLSYNISPRSIRDTVKDSRGNDSFEKEHPLEEMSILIERR